MYSRLVRIWVGDGQRGLGLKLLVPRPLPPGNLLNLTLELSEIVIVMGMIMIVIYKSHYSDSLASPPTHCRLELCSIKVGANF